jgi:hypothetical protein
VGAGPSVGHADAAGVDHKSAVGEADERHVCVPADHRANVGVKPAEDFSPTVEA